MRTAKPERMKKAADYLQSGKTVKEWSEESEINYHTLRNWLEEYRREARAANSSQEWMEIKAAAQLVDIAAAQTSLAPVRIKINGAEIEVMAGFDESALAAAVKAVRYL